PWRRSRPMADAVQVVVVEDDPEVRKQTVLLLAASFRVAAASSVEEALRLFGVSGTGVPVLVTDMRLQEDRHGGLQLARQLRQRQLATEIIFLTGYPQIEDASLCMEVGAFGYVEKGKADTFTRLGELARKALHRWLEKQGLPAARLRLLVLDDYPAILK